MKKIFLSALMLGCSLFASAQVYVGGTLGISCLNVKVSGESNTSQMYSLTPEFGYQLSPMFAIGTQVGASYLNLANEALEDDDMHVLSLSPYLRTTFARVNSVSFFADAAVTYLHTETGMHVKSDTWGVALCPGMMVNVKDNFNIIARTSLFQYNQTGKAVKIKNTGFSLNADASLGVMFTF